MAKVYSLLVRMTPQEKQRMRRVAKERGLPLSTWMRTVALDEAARKQQEVRT